MKPTKPTHLLFLLSLAVAAPLTFAAETVVEVTKVEVKTEYEKGSLTTVVTDSLSFATLKRALVAAELDATLGAKGTYTLFAPTDEAFDKLPAGLLGKLMLPENKEKLRSLLLYHVVPGKVLAADLKDGQVTTLNGEKVEVDVDDDKTEINDSKVFSADVMATNGVMHSIGTVLVPESLKDLSPLEK